MINKKGNNTVPPYISPREFRFFLTTLNAGIPDHLTEDMLKWCGVTSGNTAPLFSALRWLRLVTIIDHVYVPYPDKEMLMRLATASQRQSAFMELIRTIPPYPELLQLRKPTLDDITLQFRQRGVVKGADNKCARFFFYIAQEANHPLGEKMQIQEEFRIPRQAIEYVSSAQQPSDLKPSNAQPEPADYAIVAIDLAKDAIEHSPERLSTEMLLELREWFGGSNDPLVKDAARSFIGFAFGVLRSNPAFATPQILKELRLFKEAAEN